MTTPAIWKQVAVSSIQTGANTGEADCCPNKGLCLFLVDYSTFIPSWYTANQTPVCSPPSSPQSRPTPKHSSLSFQPLTRHSSPSLLTHRLRRHLPLTPSSLSPILSLVRMMLSGGMRMLLIF